MTRPLVLSGLQIEETLDRVSTRRMPLALAPAPLLHWYDFGVAAGVLDGEHLAALRVEQLEHDLNYWYWRAIAPEEHAERMRAILADFDAQTARNAMARRWAALDAAEEAS